MAVGGLDLHSRWGNWMEFRVSDWVFRLSAEADTIYISIYAFMYKLLRRKFVLPATHSVPSCARLLRAFANQVKGLEGVGVGTLST
jgi:hypothetical protein